MSNNQALWFVMQRVGYDGWKKLEETGSEHQAHATAARYDTRVSGRRLGLTQVWEPDTYRRWEAESIDELSEVI